MGGLTLRLDRRMVPFIPSVNEIGIDNIAILFGSYEREDRGCPEIQDCPCLPADIPAYPIVEVVRSHDERDGVLDVPCLASEKWPDLYCGIFDTRIGDACWRYPSHGDRIPFPCQYRDIERVFLLCRYALDRSSHHTYR